MPTSGKQRLTYINANTSLPEKCGSCWTGNNENVLLLPQNKGAEENSSPQSLLYIPVVGYMDSVTYLRTDLQLLPPMCISVGNAGKNITACHSERLERLMETINNPDITYPAVLLCGSGVTKQTKDEIYLTSVIDVLWNDVFANAELRSYLGRLFIATPYGVFRTRAPEGTPLIILPKLYQPTFDTWFVRAMGSIGWGTLILTPPAVPLFDSAHSGAVLTASVRVRYGYIPENSTQEALSAVAAILGVEIHYSSLHSMLYGPGGLRGVGDGSNFGCGGLIRCYLIDQYAAVLMHPDFLGGGVNGSFPARNDFAAAVENAQAIFFGSIEPALMQVLVDQRFMLATSAEDVTFTASAYWGLLRTWSADARRVPFQAPYGVGSVLVDIVPETNAYLVIVDGYQASAPLGGCGLVSQVCPSVFAPRIQDVTSDLCLSPPDSVRTDYPEASTVPLLNSYDATAVISAQRLYENCPVGFPDWVWQLLLAGSGFLVAVAVILMVQSARYNRKRRRWIARYNESIGSNLNGRGVEDGPGPAEWLLRRARRAGMSRKDAAGALVVDGMQAIRSAISACRDSSDMNGGDIVQDLVNKDGIFYDVDTLKEAIMNLGYIMQMVCCAAFIRIKKGRPAV